MNRQQKSIDAENKLIENIRNKGWSLSPKFQYINVTNKVYVICDKGHELYMLPSGINNAKPGKGCAKCRRKSENFTNLKGVEYQPPKIDITSELLTLGDLIHAKAGKTLITHCA